MSDFFSKANDIPHRYVSVPQVHGSVGEPWWLWVEDPINDHIYHSEYFLLQKKQVGIHNVIYILLCTHLADASFEVT